MQQYPIKFLPSPFTGELLDVRQAGWANKNSLKRQTHRYHCRKCGHTWQGHKRLWREKRKPEKCPSCSTQRVGNIVIESTLKVKP